MTTLVIDASVALKWLVPEEMSDTARDIYGAGDRLIAPRLITTEVANALARKTMQGLLTQQEAAYHFSALNAFLPELIDIDDFILPAFANACALRYPIYDLIYLETARRFDARFITADRRFAVKVAGSEFSRFVTFLSDWRAA